MTHRRALLAALAFAVLFAVSYSVLAPQGQRGWGSIEIVDISPRESDDRDSAVYNVTLRFPGARFGVIFRFLVLVTSAQCGFDAEMSSDRRQEYLQGDLVERVVLSPVCAADDYDMTVGLFGRRDQYIAQDTMRFSVPSSP